MKKNIIVSVVLAVLMIVSICLKSLWEGFIYFSLSFLSLLSLYWLLNYIMYYLEDYYYSFDEGFIEYKAELINSSLLTNQEIMENKKVYIKKYKKSLRKYKLIDISKILFLTTIIIVSLFAMAKGEFLL